MRIEPKTRPTLYTHTHTQNSGVLVTGRFNPEAGQLKIERESPLAAVVNGNQRSEITCRAS